MPTRRDNLLTVLRGEEPDWVPVSINFAQWFDHHQNNGTLPPELADGDYVDALLNTGFDVFSRNHDGGVRYCCQLPTRSATEETPLGRRETTIQSTPFGELRSVRQEQRSISTWHQEEYPVKDWGEQRRAIWNALEQSDSDWDETAFAKVRDRFADDGIFVVPCAQTPLKQLHWMCGLDGACYAALEEADDVDAYARAWWARIVRPLLERMAAHPRVDAVILMDNVDTPFYSPALAERLWTPYVREATEILTGRGKTLWVHACGKLSALREAYAQSRVSGLEGIAHAPLGDFEPADFRSIHPLFVYNGGFSAHEQRQQDETKLREFYADFFARTGRSRLIVASACNTAVDTAWERILMVRDLVREWGGLPS